MLHRLRRLMPFVFVVGALAAAGFAIARDFREVARAFEQLGLGEIFISLFLGLAALGATFYMWISLVRGLGIQITSGRAASIFFLTQLGKYLPGNVWPIMAQLEYGRRAGMDRAALLTANLLTLAVGLVTGLAVAVTTLPLVSPGEVKDYWWSFAMLPIILALLNPRVITRLLNWLLPLIGRNQVPEVLTWRPVLACSAWALVGWTLFGAHLLVLIDAISNLDTNTVILAIGGFAFASCVGMLFVPAPAGIGVRDAVLIGVLSSGVGLSSALAAALVSRMLLTVADVLIAGLAWTYARVSH